MSDLYWLTDEQMASLLPYFPKSHGKPRVDDRRVLSGIIFASRALLARRGAAAVAAAIPGMPPPSASMTRTLTPASPRWRRKFTSLVPLSRQARTESGRTDSVGKPCRPAASINSGRLARCNVPQHRPISRSSGLLMAPCPSEWAQDAEHPCQWSGTRRGTPSPTSAADSECSPHCLPNG